MSRCDARARSARRRGVKNAHFGVKIGPYVARATCARVANERHLTPLLRVAEYESDVGCRRSHSSKISTSLHQPSQVHLLHVPAPAPPSPPKQPGRTVFWGAELKKWFSLRDLTPSTSGSEYFLIWCPGISLWSGRTM